MPNEKSKKGVDERCRPGAAGQEEGSHQEKGQENGQKPPLLIFLKKNPEFSKKSSAVLGGLFFEIG